MPAEEITLLGLSGSLRTASSNTALLQAAARLAKPPLRIELYQDLGRLPHFNPDIEARPDLPAAVTDLRARVGASAGLIIACPEYAHGIPGAFKNALDWLVGGSEFPGKPIVLFDATVRGGHARAALIETLRTMSGRIVEEASIMLPLVGRVVDAAALAGDPTIAETIRGGLSRFVDAIQQVKNSPLLLHPE